MSVTALSIEPLSGDLGAIVRGVDCNSIDGVTASELLRAWRERRVLIFRDVVRNDDDLASLGSVFGDLIPSRFASPLASRSEIMVITNVVVDGKVAGALPDGEMEWHYDGMHQSTPYSAAILYAVTVPSKGGETSFANMCRAYEELPKPLKKRLNGLTASSSYDYTAQAGTGKEISAQTPQAVHSVIRDLPESGEKAIFVAKLMTDRIIEVDEAESRELLSALYEQMDLPQFAYEHKWQVGDAVLWDNRCVVHARNDFDSSEHRLLKRVTIR
jgi:taurine dioxygenase